MKNILEKIRKNSERGQAIILIAFAIVGMVAMVGLMTDSGILLIEYARLKRGIDSASVAAAAQFRKGFAPADMVKAGEEFLKFNQSASEVTISTCDYPGTNHDATLCAAVGQPQRKLVRVTASRYVEFGFMRVVGMNGTTITATSVGEAASLDLILVIDTSVSNAYETTGDVLDPNYATNCPSVDCVDPDRSDRSSAAHPNGDDTNHCNTNTTEPFVWVTDDVTDPAYNAADRQAYEDRRCEPLGGVIDVSLEFVKNQFYPYDRIALITSTGQQTDGTATRNAPSGPFTFIDNLTDIQNAIKVLKVFQPEDCQPPSTYAIPLTQAQSDSGDFDGTCRNYATLDESDIPIIPPYYAGVQCIRQNPNDFYGDPTTCGSSNIGGALFEAAGQFAYARQESFWVVIALITGPANATGPVLGSPDGVCPNLTGDRNSPTWRLPNDSGGYSGFCRDLDPRPLGYSPPTTNVNDPATKAYLDSYDWSTYTLATRHAAPTLLVPSPSYDADDYARDGADKITAPYPAGNGAVLFTICMGNYCRRYNNINDPASAENLGQYMALHAGDSVGPPVVTANHGIYRFAVDTSELADIFTEIAKNIQTRISQ